MPPSNFWRRSFSDDDDDIDDDDDYDSPADQLAGRESILDVAVGQIGSQFTEAHLNVHYRSRDERLIQFSNHHFYDNRLLTFPSPETKDGWLGLNDVYIPNAVYDRDNRQEAEKVVDIVFEHMRTRPKGESIGVVALSRRQADLIQRLIDDRCLLERDVDDRFVEGGAEPFFVKNLENVQGDERDHMILCIGYGPNAAGRVDNRFGPINRKGGERRLNVAITRAKLRLTVVRSLKPSDITAQSQGARLLRRFLEFVDNPETALQSEAIADAGAEYESPFESAVGRALEERGYRIARQVGVAGYRIDLAILAEDGSGIDLGIECDGATYHRAPAARDRDWLRQKVLEGMGWRVHRVWSTSWISNPDEELKSIDTAVKEARANPPLPITIVDSHDTVDRVPDNYGSNAKPIIGDSAQSTQEFDDYVEAPLGRVYGNRYWRSVAGIVDVEGPVHIEVIYGRLRDHPEFSSWRSSDLRRWLPQQIDLACIRGAVRRRGNFIWANDEQLKRRPRKPGQGMNNRDIEHISETELRAAVCLTIGEMFGGTQDEVIRQTARNLGYGRTGKRISERIGAVVDSMLAGGALARSSGSIVAGSC